MNRNESDSSSDDDNSIPGLVHRDHVSINSSDETDADDNAPNLNGYNSESESESSVPGLIDRAVSDSSDDSDTGSVNYALLHPPRHLLQSESSEASETEAETDDSSDSSNNNDAQHSDFVDMESAERQLPVPSEDTNDGHHCDNEDGCIADR